MQVKSKLFNFTDRTVSLLKIVSAMNKTSETETLEIALELMAKPEVISLINSMHGQRVDRKTFRKSRTTKKKQEPKPTQEESVDTDRNDNLNHKNNKARTEVVEDIDNTDYKQKDTDEKGEIIESVINLNICNEDLLDMYA